MDDGHIPHVPSVAIVILHEEDGSIDYKAQPSQNRKVIIPAQFFQYPSLGIDSYGDQDGHNRQKEALNEHVIAVKRVWIHEV